MSLENNKNRFPFKQIFEAAENQKQGRKVEVEIPGYPNSFVFEINGGSITAKPHSSCGDCNCDGHWRVNDDYLLDVVGNPEVYIENPAKINWEWLYN
ncbi:MAG: hypothetical protein ACTHOO_10040 [Alcanivorax sp.]